MSECECVCVCVCVKSYLVGGTERSEPGFKKQTNKRRQVVERSGRKVRPNRSEDPGYVLHGSVSAGCFTTSSVVVAVPFH